MIVIYVLLYSAIELDAYEKIGRKRCCSFLTFLDLSVVSAKKFKKHLFNKKRGKNLFLI